MFHVKHPVPFEGPGVFLPCLEGTKVPERYVGIRYSVS